MRHLETCDSRCDVVVSPGVEPRPAASSTYRLGTAHVLRVLGPLVIGLGFVWVVIAFTGLPDLVLVVLALVTVIVVAATAVLLLRPPRVLLLTAAGYRVSLVRGAGEPVAGWAQVESVDTRRVGDAVSLVISLEDGRSTVLPLTLLGLRHLEAQREVHERLNAAHGYRRLDWS